MVKKAAKHTAAKHISYAAFLRGIGPGDPKRSNESLRKVFETLGFENVRSFISSGNILFESPEKNSEKLEKKIEKRFRELSGIEVPTFIRSREELETFVTRKPFKGMEHSKKTYLTVTFMRRSASLSAATLKKMHEVSPDVKSWFDKELHALCSVIDTTVGNTPEMMAMSEKIFSKEITTRTLNTVERVLKRL